MVLKVCCVAFLLPQQVSSGQPYSLSLSEKPSGRASRLLPRFQPTPNSFIRVTAPLLGSSGSFTTLVVGVVLPLSLLPPEGFVLGFSITRPVFPLQHRHTGRIARMRNSLFITVWFCAKKDNNRLMHRPNCVLLHAKCVISPVILWLTDWSRSRKFRRHFGRCLRPGTRHCCPDGR